MEKQTLQALSEIVEGKLLAVASTDEIDRVGEAIPIDSWNFANFQKNPVLQAGHDYRPQFTIGVAKNIRIEGNKVLFEPVFHEFTQLAKEIGAMYVGNILKAWSVGFIPALKEGEKNELLEISAVAVPANANALMVTAKGMNPDEVKKVDDEINSWKQKVLEGEVEVEEKPYPNEHSCRLQDPSKFDKFRRDNGARDHNGKKYDVIYGHEKDNDKWVDQAYRYPKGEWSADAAKTHCQDHGGSFEAASKEAPIEELKGVLPFEANPKAPEGEAWDAGAEVKKAEGDGTKLKAMHAWVDSSADGYDANERRWYKLPHQKGDGSQAVVWRGVAAAMAALLGARGGVDIPTSDKQGVYNHLAKHYKQFDKEPPEFKEYTKKELEAIILKDEAPVTPPASEPTPGTDNQDTISSYMDELKNDVDGIVEEYKQMLLNDVKSIISSVTKEIDITKKEGRVLSAKNRATIQNAITTAKAAVIALEKLLEMSNPPKNEPPKKSEGDDVNKKGREPKVVLPANIGGEIIVRALQKIAKNSNFALNQINRSKK